jgi:predicted transposase YbfD/YdcC
MLRRHADERGFAGGRGLRGGLKVLTPKSHREGPHPVSSSQTFTVVDAFDEDEFFDVPVAPAGLLATLSEVPDPRKARGKRHLLSALLAVAVCAVTAGARSYVAIAGWVHAAPPALLTRLGVTGERPSESTIRRTLQRIEADLLDRIIGGWAQRQEPAAAGRRVIAVDGKSVRGARTDGRCRHLLSAVTHRTSIILGQLNVDLKTNEIPMFATLLDTIDITGAVITADALHLQTAHATYLQDRKAHYLLTVKGNQPTLRKQLASQPWKDVPVGHRSTDRGHGRIENRTVKVLTITAGIAFPHAAQALQITRRTRRLDSRKWSTEVVYAVTSLAAVQAQPRDLATWIRGHWGIENRLHWVRDVTFAEDHSQARTGAGPQVMATIRNLVISLLRLAGATNIAAALRHHSYQHKHPTRLLLTS